jgi:methyltransferase family protein
MAMREASLERLARVIPDDALVLDVGGWIMPFTRADWVIDLMPYETRGQDGTQGEGPERFGAETWLQRDICGREPWPFEDDQFDFAVCGHTLEDVRDPVRVCGELIRVARAGYIEVPSRLEEQSYGFQGPWVGWGHHRWLVDVTENRIDFVLKHHVIHRPEANSFPLRFYRKLSEDEKAKPFWWEGSFEYGERILMSFEGLDSYLGDFVASRWPVNSPRQRASRFLRRVADRIR